MPRTALIVAGGARPDPLVVRALPPVDFTVAADGGADHALSLGLAVDAVVGDMDSITADGLARLRSSGAEVVEYSASKDQTDLELAFARVVDELPNRIVVIGLGGGRLDHALANVSVLAADGYGDAEVDGLIGSARLSVIRGVRTLTGALGETISLLPVLGRADGVTTDGLEYELVAEPLEPGSARGVSNRFVAATATVSVADGVLLAVQPFGLKERDRR
ncbi:MAG: thiamine diphosphokinase [Acidimicrobiales bacterium]